jgi:hypothetical protein
MGICKVHCFSGAAREALIMTNNSNLKGLGIIVANLKQM